MGDFSVNYYFYIVHKGVNTDGINKGDGAFRLDQPQ